MFTAREEAIRILSFEGGRLSGIALGMVAVSGRDSKQSVDREFASDVLLNAVEHLVNEHAPCYDSVGMLYPDWKHELGVIKI